MSKSNKICVCAGSRNHPNTFEDLQVVGGIGEKGTNWGTPIGKAREEAEGRSQRVFRENRCIPRLVATTQLSVNI